LIEVNDFFKTKKVKINSSLSSTSSGLQKMLVDVHEPEAIVETLRQEKGIFVERVPLPVGDYAFSNIIIERKTLNDFYNSIVSGNKRIWNQVFNLRRACERPFLVIERWNDAFLLDARRARIVFGALARIALMGISIIIIPGSGRNYRDFVEFLSFLYFASDKKAASIKPIPKKKATNLREIWSDMLCMIPSIGRKMADEIASRISSFQEFCNMTPEEWKKLCPRIGRKRLNLMKKVIYGVKDKTLSEFENKSTSSNTNNKDTKDSNSKC